MKKQNTETDIAGLVNRMCEQLGALERKIDTLIARPPERASSRDRFQKPGPHFRRNDRPGFAKHDPRPRENNFTKAVCAKCGKECELPFRPTGDRPVFCRDCFSAQKDPAGSFKPRFADRSQEGRSPRGRKFDDRNGAKGPRSDKKRVPFFLKRKKHF